MTMPPLIKTGTQETARLRLALAFVAERLDAVLALVPESARGEAAYVNGVRAVAAVKGKATSVPAVDAHAGAEPLNGAAGSLPEPPIAPNDPTVIEATAEPTLDAAPAAPAPTPRKKAKREADPTTAAPPAQANGTSPDAPVEDAAK